MSDVRVPLAPMLAAFGVAATVRRPHPDPPVEATGFWTEPQHDEQLPYGSDMATREPRRVFVLQRAGGLTTMPRNTLIDAPEELGGAVVRWRVDGLERVEADAWRVFLVLAR